MALSTFGSIVSATSFMIEKFSFLNLSGRYYPDWLNELRRGESPLLGRAEWEFITKVQNLIIEQASSRPYICDRPPSNKLSSMKNNFDEVVQYLKDCSQCTQYFVINYPQWREFRDQTIKKLIHIAESVDINKKESAEVKQAGNSLQQIGGLVCLATGAGAIGLLGKAMVGFGSLSTIVASVGECSKQRKMVKEAEEIIKLDKEYSERLWNWISDVSHIQKALNSIRNIDVDPKLKTVAIDLNACFKNKSSPEQLKMVIQTAMKSLEFSSETIIEISDVIGILIAISMLSERYRPLFIQAFEAYQCYKELSTACNVVAATLHLTSGAVQLNSLEKSRILTGVALKAIDLIFASKDLESKSKEVEDILKTAEKLKVEAKVFQKLYNKVRRL